MSAYLSPFGNSQQSDANGSPLSGGKIWTYVAGTSTPATTYTAEDGLTPQANPIILNARGIPANPIWLQGGQSYKLVVTDSNDVVLQTVDDIQGINDPSAVSTQDQWVTFTGTATYINATSFSVAGDQTPTLQIGRRLRTINSGGTIYSTISNAVFGAGITTVTVVNDSGTLDAGLSAVSYGLLSYNNPSIPETTIGKAVRTAATAADVHAVVPILSLPVQASTSGTAIDFTAIPSWVRRITVPFVGVSTNGNSNVMVQIGDSGGFETSGYLGAVSQTSNAAAVASVNFTTGFGVTAAMQATSVFHGAITLVLVNQSTNTWTSTVSIGFSDSAQSHSGGGSKSLSDVLTQVRVTTVGGANTFDLGSIGLLYE